MTVLERELLAQVKALRYEIQVHELMVWGDLPVEKPHDRRLYAAGRAADRAIAEAEGRKP